MPYNIDGLLGLWTDASATEAHFRQWYTDPFQLNGSNVTPAQLLARSRELRAALRPLRRIILDVCRGEHTLAVAFELSGQHIGELTVAGSTLQPSGQHLRIRVIDILTLDASGRIRAITMSAEPLPR